MKLKSMNSDLSLRWHGMAALTIAGLLALLYMSAKKMIFG